MSDTGTNRKYAWALQSDYATQKPIAAGNYKQIIVTDENTIDYEPQIADNEGWSHGVNSPTEEWIENHSAKVQHTMPGHAQEMGKVFYLNMADTVSTPVGGTLSRKHTFVPTDPTVTRQDKAVSYVEKIAAGWHKLMPSSVSDGFSLKGEGGGLLMLDFSLIGSGKIINDPAITYPPTSTPTVTNLTGLYKFFNSQVNITPNDGGSYNTAYGCAYRAFQIDFKKTMLDAAGYKPGCQNFQSSGNPDSGMIRSAHEFDKQSLEFNFDVDLAAGSPEFAAVQDQRPISLIVAATGAFIEGSIPYALVATINIAKYRTTKPKLVDNAWQLGISGKSLFDVSANKLFQIELTNNVVSYASAF